MVSSIGRTIQGHSRALRPLQHTRVLILFAAMASPGSRGVHLGRPCPPFVPSIMVSSPTGGRLPPCCTTGRPPGTAAAPRAALSRPTTARYPRHRSDAAGNVRHSRAPVNPRSAATMPCGRNPTGYGLSFRENSNSRSRYLIWAGARRWVAPFRGDHTQRPSPATGQTSAPLSAHLVNLETTSRPPRRQSTFTPTVSL